MGYGVSPDNVFVGMGVSSVKPLRSAFSYGRDGDGMGISNFERSNGMTEPPLGSMRVEPFTVVGMNEDKEQLVLKPNESRFMGGNAVAVRCECLLVKDRDTSHDHTNDFYSDMDNRKERVRASWDSALDEYVLDGESDMFLISGRHVSADYDSDYYGTGTRWSDRGVVNVVKEPRGEFDFSDLKGKDRKYVADWMASHGFRKDSDMSDESSDMYRDSYVEIRFNY